MIRIILLGWVLIDRDGSLFRFVLNYLRDGDVTPPDSESDKHALLKEARYYGIDGLIKLMENHLFKPAAPMTRCVLPIVTCDEEDAALIASTRTGRPIVKFIYSRGNNKFSYTTPSDDALLRNIELFDKISLKFSGRILYVKEVSGKSGHICTW